MPLAFTQLKGVLWPNKSVTTALNVVELLAKTPAVKKLSVVAEVVPFMLTVWVRFAPKLLVLLL